MEFKCIFVETLNPELLVAFQNVKSTLSIPQEWPTVDPELIRLVTLKLTSDNLFVEQNTIY